VKRIGHHIQKQDLYSKFAVAEEQAARGDRGRPLDVVMKNLRKRIRELTPRHPS